MEEERSVENIGDWGGGGDKGPYEVPSLDGIVEVLNGIVRVLASKTLCIFRKKVIDSLVRLKREGERERKRERVCLPSFSKKPSPCLPCNGTCSRQAGCPC